MCKRKDSIILTICLLHLFPIPKNP
jgi:hypothetical protein